MDYKNAMVGIWAFHAAPQNDKRGESAVGEFHFYCHCPDSVHVYLAGGEVSWVSFSCGAFLDGPP